MHEFVFVAIMITFSLIVIYVSVSSLLFWFRVSWLVSLVMHCHLRIVLTHRYLLCNYTPVLLGS